MSVGKSIQALRLASEKATEEALKPGYFTCSMPKEDRAPDCSGVGYRIRNGQTKCILCEQWEARRARLGLL